MSDVKSKSKKVDVRLSDERFEEIAIVAWARGMNRSELVRTVIDDFMQRGALEMGGQIMTWSECVDYARLKMFKENVLLDDLQRSRGKKSVDMPEEVQEGLKEDLEWFAELYAQNALDALKKHVGE